MIIQEIENSIEELEEERNRIFERLEEFVFRFLKNLSDQAETWILDEVANRIREKSEYIEKMDRDRLRDLKRELNEIQFHLSEIVRDEMPTKAHWPHNHCKVPGSDSSSNKPSCFDVTFRNTVSHIGPVLYRYGLISMKSGENLNWKMLPSEKILYTKQMEFGSDLHELIQGYDEGLAIYRNVEKRIAEEYKRLSEARAEELWHAV